ncbi:hypothetical protein D3C72_2402410 [compost metagenome]
MVEANTQRAVGVAGAEVPGMIAARAGLLGIERVRCHCSEAAENRRFVAHGVVEVITREVGAIDGTDHIQ